MTRLFCPQAVLVCLWLSSLSNPSLCFQVSAPAPLSWLWWELLAAAVPTTCPCWAFPLVSGCSSAATASSGLPALLVRAACGLCHCVPPLPMGLAGPYQLGTTWDQCPWTCLLYFQVTPGEAQSACSHARGLHRHTEQNHKV